MGRPTKVDDLACERIVALAEAVDRAVINPLTPAQRELRRHLDEVGIADDVVVMNVRRSARARDRVGVLQSVKRNARGYVEKYELLTPRGRIVWWTNVCLISLPRSAD
jgi:hypothetical protein